MFYLNVAFGRRREVEGELVRHNCEANDFKIKC